MAESEFLKQAASSRVAQRKAADGHARAPEHPVLRLQRQLGNQHVSRMIQRESEDGELQAKHDASIAQREEEMEAEDEEVQAKHDASIAQREEEMEAEDEEVQAKHDASIAQREEGVEEEDEQVQAKHDASIAQREEEMEAEDEEVQAKHDASIAQRKAEAPRIGLEGGPVDDDLQQRINAKRGGGSGLGDSMRTSMESAMGTSFADVRVHRDSESDSLNRAMTAKAFTTGSDIFLREDQSTSDSKLLAHELTHVVQQRSMPGGGGMTVGAAEDSHEHEADKVAEAVTAGSAQRLPDELHAH